MGKLNISKIFPLLEPKYDLDENPIGKGGFATVFEARDKLKASGAPHND